MATKMNQGDVVRMLLSCGADPGVQNARGLNAIDVATSEQMRLIYVEELLRATANSEVGRVCQLIAAGISINSWDSEDSRNTPLHWAACYGNKDIVTCLIDRGADVNAMNSCGATALHDAVLRGDRDIVEELMQSGANPLIQSLKGKFGGKTPLDLAAQKPELLVLVRTFTSFSPSVNGHQDIGVSSHQLQHGITVTTGGGSGGGGRVRSVSVESFSNGVRGDMLNHRDGSTVSVHGHGFQSERKPSTRSLNTILFSSQASSLDLSPRIDQAIENLVRTHISTPVRPLVINNSLHLLWPQPQRMVELEGPPFVPQKELRISIIQSPVLIHRILDVWDICQPALLTLGFDVKIGDIQPSCGKWTESQVECIVSEDLFPSKDSYQIHINSTRVRIAAGSLPSLHYSLCTFIQLLRLSGGEPGSSVLVPVLIQDHPTIRHRAVLLDISPRGRVPSPDFLFQMVSLWSSLKVSHLHLYTQLLPSSEWQLPFTRSEMVTIDRYCQDRFIDLVPVLDVESHVSYEDLTDMWPTFQEILASFPNLRYVHIGPKLCSLLVRPEEGDEGDGVSSDGSGQCVGLQELWHHLALPPDITVMLCGNGIQQHGTLALPSNILLVQYGFQADYDFLEWTRDFHQQGAMTCLCPGTASWNSLAGCPEASICNIYRAVQAVGELESLGVIVAHWSGSYHLTPHPFGWPGFVVGSGLSWNPDTHWDYLHNSLSDLLNSHIFLDSENVVGRVIIELGYAETYALRSCRGQDQGDLSDLPAQDGSTLYKLLTDPDNVNLENLSLDIFGRVTKHIKRCQNNLFRAKLRCLFGEMVIQELQLAADLMLTACRIGRTLIGVGTNPNSNMGLAVINLGVCNLPPTFRTDIANKLLAHIEQYKGTWLQRHLPAGLQSSLLVLTSALHRFVPDEPQVT
ncbi:uncharacterized protein LOC110837829 isoform X2 [Zootermopsis nevadensis]|nr:uncharacterized protein LOC110837829 isoform X2 [Zootermopsis nevadensis]XP_021936075.1 uncharacterized protein LOC110837829 isoform X2 [Zootermopsis nevadensis]